MISFKYAKSDIVDLCSGYIPEPGMNDYIKVVYQIDLQLHENGKPNRNSNYIKTFSLICFRI